MKRVFLYFLFYIFFLNAISFSGEVKHFSLQQAIETALKNNKELKELEKNILISEAKIKEAKAQKKLSFGLQGNYRITEKETLMKSIRYKEYLPVNIKMPPVGEGELLVPAPLSPYSYLIPANPEVYETPMSEKKQKGLTLSASLPIWTSGKLEGIIKSANLSKEMDILNFKKMKNKVIFEVKQAYYNCLLSNEFVNVCKEDLVKAEEHYNAAKKKYELGMIAKFDVIRAEVEKASAEENLTKAKKLQKLAKMNLNNLLGLSLDDEIILEDKLEIHKVNYNFDECLSYALKERKEIEQLQLAEDQARISAKISRLLPTVGIKVDYPIRSTGSLYSQERVWSGVVFLDYPLFDSGSSSAKVSQAKESENKIRISKERLLDGIKLQIKEAFLSLQEAEKRVETSQVILKQADEALRMAEIGYKEGVTSNLELIDARISKTKAKLNYIQAIFDYKIAEAKLLFAMGKEE